MKIPEVGESWGYRIRCCEEDLGGSHYHCPACGRVGSMYGCVSGKPPTRRCTGRTVPDHYGDLLAVTGPFDGPAPWVKEEDGNG